MERASESLANVWDFAELSSDVGSEELAGPEEIAIVGNEAEIKDRLQAAFDAGADDVIVAEFEAIPINGTEPGLLYNVASLICLVATGRVKVIGRQFHLRGVIVTFASS